MSDWFDKLRDDLETQGQDPVVLSAGEGRLLAVRHGARLLAVDVPWLDENPFFTATAGGMLTGGDRLWIAPQVGFYWPSLAEGRRDSKTESCPPAIDPADWQVTGEHDEIFEVVTDIGLTDIRLEKSIRVKVTRALTGTTRPVQIDEQLSTTSFAIENVIEIAGGDAGAMAGVWDLLQVPPTGTLVVPVISKVDPTSYFNPLGQHMQADDNAVRFLIDGKRRVKIGITASASAGRIGYYRPVGDGQALLIVRFFSPQPESPYCDLPLSAPDDQLFGGDCVQAYNDEGDSFGGVIGSDITFGEMEHHDPCVIVGQGPQQRTNACITHIITGPTTAVLDAGEQLLGVEVSPFA